MLWHSHSHDSFPHCSLVQVLDHGSFKEFLELVPHVRDLISSFYHTKYDQCLGALNALRVCTP